MKKNKAQPNDLKKPDKTLSMSNTDLQIMSYFESQFKARQIEMNMWNQKIQELKSAFLKSSGIEREKYLEDWDEVWSSNKVYLYKKQEPENVEKQS